MGGALGSLAEGFYVHNPQATYDTTFGPALSEQRYEAQSDTAAQNAQNRPNIVNPYGTTQWRGDDKTGYRLDQTFTGPMARAANSVQHDLATAAASPLTAQGTRQQAIGNAYGNMTSQLNPQWDARQAAMQRQLQNQGVDLSSPQAQAQMAQFNGQRGDAYNSAMNAATGFGAAGGAQLMNQGQAVRTGDIQQMQQMLNMLRQPNFNQAAAATPVQMMSATEAGTDYALGRAAKTAQQTTDAVSGTAQLANGLAQYRQEYGNSD